MSLRNEIFQACNLATQQKKQKILSYQPKIQNAYSNLKQARLAYQNDQLVLQQIQKIQRQSERLKDRNIYANLNMYKKFNNVRNAMKNQNAFLKYQEAANNGQVLLIEIRQILVDGQTIYHIALNIGGKESPIQVFEVNEVDFFNFVEQEAQSSRGIFQAALDKTGSVSYKLKDALTTQRVYNKFSKQKNIFKNITNEYSMLEFNSKKGVQASMNAIKQYELAAKNQNFARGLEFADLWKYGQSFENALNKNYRDNVSSIIQQDINILNANDELLMIQDKVFSGGFGFTISNFQTIENSLQHYLEYIKLYSDNSQQEIDKHLKGNLDEVIQKQIIQDLQSKI